MVVPTTYVAQVTPGTAADGTEYTLVVTRGTDFEAERNADFDDAQAAGNVVGHVTTESFSGTTVLSDFPGMDLNDTLCNCQPPDTHGAVGPNHFVEVVNSAITIYNKDGTIAQGPTEFEQLLTMRPMVAGESLIFDPVVIYDELAERFAVVVLIAASSSSAEVDVLYAISDTVRSHPRIHRTASF